MKAAVTSYTVKIEETGAIVSAKNVQELINALPRTLTGKEFNGSCSAWIKSLISSGKIAVVSAPAWLANCKAEVKEVAPVTSEIASETIENSSDEKFIPAKNETFGTMIRRIWANDDAPVYGCQTREEWEKSQLVDTCQTVEEWSHTISYDMEALSLLAKVSPELYVKKYSSLVN